MKLLRKPTCDWYAAPQQTPLTDIRCSRCKRWASNHLPVITANCGLYGQESATLSSFWPDTKAERRTVPEGKEEHTQKVYLQYVQPDRRSKLR